MNELFLVRHGQAEHLVSEISGGWTDTKLTDLGREQAKLTGFKLKNLLKSKKIRIYCSDLSRANETAQIISATMNVNFEALKELREINTGKATNLTQKEADQIRQPITYPILDWVPYPGGEGRRMMSERIRKFMESLDREEFDITIIITHGGPLICLVHNWLGLPEEFESKISYQFDPCSITQLGINRHDEKTIYKLNDTAHLLSLKQ